VKQAPRHEGASGKWHFNSGGIRRWAIS